jgi:hypothetical protein
MRFWLLILGVWGGALWAQSTDVAVSLSADADIVGVGENLAVTATVDNLSVDPAPDITLSCVLPLGFTLIEASDGGILNETTRTITWPSFSLNGSEQTTRDFSVTAMLPDGGMPFFFLARQIADDKRFIYQVSQGTVEPFGDELPGLFDPSGLLLDDFGHFWVLDRGNPNLIDGNDEPISDGQLRRYDSDGLMLISSGELMVNPSDLIMLSDGNLLVVDPDGLRDDGGGGVSGDQSGRIYLIDPGTGVQTLFFEGAPLDKPTDVTLGPDGRIYVIDSSLRLISFDYPSSSPNLHIDGGLFQNPTGITYHPDHGIVVSDTVAGLIQVDPTDFSASVLTPIGGSPTPLDLPLDLDFLLGGELWTNSSGTPNDGAMLEISPSDGEIKGDAIDTQIYDYGKMTASEFLQTQATIDLTGTVDPDLANNNYDLYTRLSITPVAPVVISVTENIGVVDTADVDLAVQINITEPITVADTALAELAVQIAVQEAITVGDTATANLAVQISVQETVSVTDTALTALAVQIMLAEIASVSDTAQASASSGAVSMEHVFFPQNRLILGESGARFSPTQIFLQFSEIMNDPPGDEETTDVTNPVHYTLVRSDSQPTMESCGLPGPEDQLIPIAGVDFFKEITSAVLRIPQGLAPGKYRLVVCGESGLQDLEGLGFDGDGDEEPGGDFLVDFEVLAGSPLSNPHFDSDLEGWSTVGEGTLAMIAEDDANGLPGSGSLSLSNASSMEEGAIFQCIEVVGDRWYQIGTRLRNVMGGDATFPVFARIEWYGQSGCGSTEPLDVFEQEMVFGNTQFEWPVFGDSVKAPPEAVSARVSFGIRAGGGLGNPLNWDDIRFVQDTEFVFGDGFESGDLTNWVLE